MNILICNVWLVVLPGITVKYTFSADIKKKFPKVCYTEIHLMLVALVYGFLMRTIWTFV